MARAGWVIVGQDTRGRGESEGDAEPFVHEAADGAATVAWCARQPWSDGRVAMWGGSYLGFTQWAAASRRPPALRAIGPLAAPTDLLPRLALRRRRVLHGHRDDLERVDGRRRRVAPEARPQAHRRAQRRLAHPARVPARRATARQLYPPYRRLLDPRDRRYWGAFDLTRRYRSMDIAAIQLAGWYDIFCEGSIRAWQAMTL